MPECPGEIPEPRISLHTTALPDFVKNVDIHFLLISA